LRGRAEGDVCEVEGAFVVERQGQGLALLEIELDVALAQLVACGRADGEALAVDVESEDGWRALLASAHVEQRVD
jgi:hypothetical protein